MPDPFEMLRERMAPIAPDPTFATHLRGRLVRALALPKGVIVSNVALEPVPAAPAAGGRADAAVVAYLTVADARGAIDWYVEVLHAVPRGEPFVMADGRVGHAELAIAGGTIYLADESPESHVAAPRPGAAATVSLTVSVSDVDDVAARATRQGALLERPAADHPYGRNAVIRDPYGHRWIVSAPTPTLAPLPAAGPEAPAASLSPPAGPATQAGDIGYVSLWVPDAERAAEFFADVLGWDYRPGGGGRARQIEGLSLPHGLLGGQERATLFLCFVVDDLDAAVARVRGAGGQTAGPTAQPHGRTADCVDDQGAPFALVEAPPGEAGLRGPLNGSRHGDLSYVTMEVRDTARARAFYGSVLGWRFTAGRVEDGWVPVDVVPMTGMHGGHREATTVPMYRVDDIGAAVARVWARGGRSTDPERQSYGWTAECADDQGTRFYLGQP